jgi:hypothetical protein
MARIKIVLLTLALVALWGCNQAKKEEAQAPPASPPAAAPGTATQSAPAPVPTNQPARPAQSAATPGKSTARQPAAKPKGQTVGSLPPSTTSERVAPAPPARPAPAILAAGTSIPVRLSEALDSSKNRTGDKFEAILDADLEVDDRVVIPRGAIVTGKVTEVVDSGKVQGLARMSVTLSEIEIRGTNYAIRTNTQSFEAKTSKKEDAIKIGAGAGVGAIIGAIAGGKKGAAIGAATGAGAGTGVVLATKGKDVELPSEEKLTFRLEKEVRVERR